MRKTISLNVLDNVEIATPCTARWEEMAGNDQTRYCSHCSLNVYNLSGMTRQEATDVIAGAEGRVCIRLYRRADGTVLTQDCPTGLRAARERAVRSIRNIAATVAALFAGIAGFGAKQAWAQDDSPRHIMGGMRPVHVQPQQSEPKRDTIQAQDTAAVDESRTLIMGQMMVVPEEETQARVKTEPAAVRPAGIDAAALAPRAVEPRMPRPLRIGLFATEPSTIETPDAEPDEAEPIFTSGFAMGEMMVVDRPAPQPGNAVPVDRTPNDEPVCDPDAPAIDDVARPGIE